jgi:aryl carrier-like protein
MYGPTETTIWSAVSPVNQGPAPVRIGPPIANTQFYVLDRHRHPAPLGVPGELYIGGDGVARGYFERPDLTLRNFSSDPFRPGQPGRMYRTGDLARALPDGTLEFLGRIDNQVKIRGFRIELGEIESALLAAASVQEAVVVVDGEGGQKKLIAYVVTADGDCDPVELKSALSNALPAYMLPAAFVSLASIPRTPNGKVNRRALPRPDFSRPARLSRAPRNQTEELLSGIFSEVLRLGTVSIDDNLFELGADSIQVFQIVARANRAGIGVTAQQLLRHPSIQGLAEAMPESVEVISNNEAGSIRPVARERYRVKPETPAR